MIPTTRERVLELEKALLPFVLAYQREAEPIGDSDLYNEQPRSVHVLLGDCRHAERVLKDQRWNLV